MSLTRGQHQAVRDLRRLDAADPGFRLTRVKDDVNRHGDLIVVVEVDVRSFERREGGFPMQDWETIGFAIPPEFPLRPPTACVTHNRWEEREHVMWEGILCLYRAPDVEWDPSRGILGFVTKLEVWLRDAAAGTLDPVGVPLHPPAAFPARADAVTIVVRAETPEVTHAGWFGFAQLERVRDDRFDVVGWRGGNPHNMTPPIACAWLSRQALSGVYPRHVGQLLATLTRLGTPTTQMMSGIKDALRVTPQGCELIVILGTEQRGVVGDAMLPHLVAWRIEPAIVDQLRTLLLTPENGTAVEDLYQWDSAPVDWCHVQEAREQVTVRRDRDTPMSFFNGKAVEIWGCGALGGWLAEMLARAGAARIVLRDCRRVSIGSLVRQPYSDDDVGKPKTRALQERLNDIKPSLDVEACQGDVVAWLHAGGRSQDADLIINATASRAVDSALEAAAPLFPAAPVATVGISGSAHVGRVVLCPPGHPTGPVDSKRKTRLRLEQDPAFDPSGHLLQAFWQTTQAPLEPEPGCSEPTFAGSAADVLTLVAALINQLAQRLTDSPQHAFAGFITSPISENGPAAHWLDLPSDTALESKDYRVMLAPTAREAILSEMSASADRGQGAETGGLLFGERDDAAARLWVTTATGPPEDSSHAPHGFVCGTKDTQSWADALHDTHGDAVSFVGTWHTHPGGPTHPSEKDYTTMKQLVEETDTPLSAGLLLVVGGSPDQPSFKAHLLWEDGPPGP